MAKQHVKKNESWKLSAHGHKSFHGSLYCLYYRQPKDIPLNVCVYTAFPCTSVPAILTATALASQQAGNFLPFAFSWQNNKPNRQRNHRSERWNCQSKFIAAEKDEFCWSRSAQQCEMGNEQAKWRKSARNSYCKYSTACMFLTCCTPACLYVCVRVLVVLTKVSYSVKVCAEIISNGTFLQNY